MINWKPYFPNGYKPRDIQTEAIDFILDTFFVKNKKYCVVEAPTGTGKSFIAAAVAQYIKNVLNGDSYILTTQIILQQQYKREFEQYSNISARRNYKCKLFPESNCAEMQLLHEHGSLPKCQDCVYQVLRNQFVENPIAITNTSYFMANVIHFEQLLKKRKMLFIDEAHNLEEQILRFKELNLNFKQLKRDYGLTQEEWIQKDENVLDYVFKRFFYWVEDKLEIYSANVAGTNRITLTKNKIIELRRKLENITRLYWGLRQVAGNFDPDTWVIDYNNYNNEILFKPLFAKTYANQLMFEKGEKVLLMSGSILDKETYCASLGISLKNCEFLSLDSPFPIQNRRVFITSSGSMSRKNIDNSLPKVIKDIKKILELHKDDKGIIHVSSHAIARRIVDELNDKRLCIVDDFDSRDQMLEFHHETGSNNVLISPSLMQGVDLKDDLSRFQIIAKIPFPNLGNKYIFTKKDRVKKWYSYQTAKIIVQAYGRSIRDQTDYAMTYIVDSDFNFFYKMNSKMLPKYFVEALSKGSL